jgi:hypothetical protein
MVWFSFSVFISLDFFGFCANEACWVSEDELDLGLTEALNESDGAGYVVLCCTLCSMGWHACQTPGGEK